MMTIDDALALAIRWHQEGALDAASAIYRQILDVVPGHFDALHLGGVVARRRGDTRIAARQIRQASALQPDNAEAYANLGNTLRDLGQVQEAETAFGRAVRLRPGLAAAHMGLVSTLRALGRLDDAVAAWHTAIAAAPEEAEFRNGLGNLLHERERLDEATAAYRTALALDPAQFHAWSNLGTALRGLGRPEEAAVCHHRALAVQPDFAAAWSGLGLTLVERDRPAAAAACHRRALAAQPDFAGAWSNLGSAQLSLNRTGDAVAAFRRAIAIEPEGPVPHRNLGMALLLQGDLEAAWPEYEWRLRCPDSPVRTRLPQPRWNGAPFPDRTLLLHAEQGMGDVLQFVRYVPMAAARGGRVLVCAPAELERLFASLAGMAAFVLAGTPVPPFDLHAPLLSLPGLFGTTLETAAATAPPGEPYLRPPPLATRRWGERLAGEPGLRVGLVWAGSPTHGNDRNRSLPLAAFAPLAAVPGVRLVSIQKGPAAAQAENPPLGMDLLNLSPAIADFADTAAIMAALHLVISVDTSVAHLAGALGRPVWVLVPHSPDWRWLLGRDDSPWYPSLRLFRQERPGEWEPVVGTLARHLRLLTGH